MTTRYRRSTKPSRARTFRIIGTRPVRPGDADKVTGQALFGEDVRLPGMLYGAILRSPHAHARIVAIDTRGAEALPGVRAVVTAADLPALSESAAPGEGGVAVAERDNLLAREKVLYSGHAVAAVAATSPHLAAEALERIQVTYDVLPPVLDARQAMAEGAPILHPGLRTDDMTGSSRGPTNIATHLLVKRGNLEKGFRRATVIVEREFETASVHQGYVEPQNATALFALDGRLTLWCSTQGAFSVREQVAEALQIQAAHIRVIPLEVGGGFGGKNRVYLEPVAALLSRKSGGKPVKLVMSHAEVLAATGPAPASHIRVKLGADRLGRLTAASARLVYASGAFPTWGAASGMDVLFGAYRIDNLELEGYDVVVNTPWASTYRAPGAANAAFAGEACVDEVCEKLGMDPLEFRRLNGVREGDRRPGGGTFGPIGFLETLEAAQQHPHYLSRLSGPHQGRGVASAYWGNASGRSSASASLNPDGTVSLVTGSVDLSGTRLTLAMQLAETLGIPVDDIRTTVADTDSTGYADGTWGSRTTFSTGWAVIELGKNLIRLLRQRAAANWQVPLEQVTFADGLFSIGARRLAFKKVAATLSADLPVLASATANPSGEEGPAFATHIVDVEVDPETGQVRILRYTAVQDVGRAVHPAYVEGQIQGGATQGMGWALNEGYVYDEAGRMLNAGFLDYRIPICSDLPPIETVIVEVPHPGHPYGVRGAGEISIVPPPAAIANAIHAATGLRPGALPMSPARILEALWAKEGRPE
jgi:CO/xanthine dehydrogenase Mo-binding subunit